MRPATAAPMEEADAFLTAHPEIVAVDIFLIDPNGIPRGKTIRRHELAALYRDGRHLPGSILGLDITGADVEETGLVWSDGDADRRGWPVPGSLKLAPWTTPPRAQVQLTLHELDGSPMAADPRHALARQADRLKADNRHPVMAFELEFYLLDRQPGPDGRPQPARLPLTGERPEMIQVYGTEPLDRLSPFTEEVYRAAAVQGLPLETLISEYAPGQYELTLHHRGDALSAADDLVGLKRLLKAMAARAGMIACFMAKPFPGLAGSGMHLHVSLADSDGRNRFADPAAGTLAPELTASIAGLLATLPEAMLIFAPHLNSWRRFAVGSYAPTAPTWGINNRSVAVRVPAGSAAGRHLEQRMAGVDANPYLVGAVTLAAMRAGLAAGADPGPASAHYAPDATDILPPDWRDAIVTAGRSAFLKETLGDRLHHVLLALKRAEYRLFAGEVTEMEYRRTLESF